MLIQPAALSLLHLSSLISSTVEHAVAWVGKEEVPGEKPDTCFLLNSSGMWVLNFSKLL